MKMIITADLLRRHGACADECAEVERLWPDGVVPTVEVLEQAARHEWTSSDGCQRHGLDWLWLTELLPAEGPGSRRDYALQCVEPVAHLLRDERSRHCLDVVRRRVADPASVSDEELAEARAAAWTADGAAARAAAGAAARTAARAAAREAAAAGAEAWTAARTATREAAAAGAEAWAEAWAAAWAEAEDRQRALLARMLEAVEDCA